MLETTSTLDCYDALRHVAGGQRVTRLEWGDEGIFLSVIDGRLCITYPDKLPAPLLVSLGDLVGTDWVIV